MGSLVFRITGDPASFKAAMGDVSTALDRAGQKAQQVSQKLQSFGNTLSVSLTLPMLAAGSAVVKTAADMESLRLGLASVAKASDTTEQQLVRLKEVAKLPGLGFKEAIQGSIALQSAGFSAQLAERSLKAFGNALATVGKGKADLDGVTLALSQIASKGKISAEEINQLAERVPQIRKAMLAAFGTADTEILQKAGIGAEEFVTEVVAQLEKLKTVAGGTKNSFENTSDAIRDMADRIGTKLLPAVNALLPKIESIAVGAADMVDGFTKLPPQIQNTALAIGALTLAAGPALSFIGKISAAIGAIRGVAGTAGVALGSLFGATIIASIGQTLSAIDALNARYADLKKARDLVASGKADPGSGLTESGQDLGKFKIDLKAVSDELNLFGIAAKGAAGPSGEFISAVEEMTKRMPPLKKVTAESEILMRLMTEAVQKHASQLDKTADIVRRYGTVSVEAATKAARAWDDYFKITRELDDPALFGAGAGLSHPKLKDITFNPNIDEIIPGLPRQLPNMAGSDKNIGPEGMMTKEQFDAWKQRTKEMGKVATAATRQVSLVLNDLSRGITDVIFKGGKIGDMLKSVASQAAQSITRVLIEGALSKLASKLFEVGGIMGKVFGGATSVGGSIFSAASGAAGTAAGGVASAAGGVASTVGSIAGMGVSALTGIVTGVGSLVSGIIGNFQFMAMNKSLDLIEHEVRYSQIHLLNTLNKANEFWPYMKNCWESLVRMEGRQMSPAGAAASGTTINMAGAYLLTDSTLDDFIERISRKLKQQGL